MAKLLKFASRDAQKGHEQIFEDNNPSYNN